MKIAISPGHGTKIRGASGPPPWGCDEVDECQAIVPVIARYCRAAGAEVVEIVDHHSTDQDQNLKWLVSQHNAAFGGDHGDSRLDVSVHMNAYQTTTTTPRGTEVWFATQRDLSEAVASEIAMASGLIDRGAKSNGLYFLSNTASKAILIELAFCDSKPDCDLFRTHADAIARAIAETISNGEIGEQPPERPERPPRPEEVPVSERPTLRQGDEGDDVLDMQRMIPRFTGEFDGDFGPTTLENVTRYQRTRGLDVDGICGQQTWQALYEHRLPTLPELPPGALTADEQYDIMRIANESLIADYSWPDRGVAPTGYTQGMALSFAQTYKKLKAGHPAAIEMAKARTSSEKDVLNLWREEFENLGMFNEEPGIDTLRHLYAFMLGSGMRESSGQHCCGRDQSASNYDSMTCEAGAFQTSANAMSATSPEADNLLDEYLQGLSPGYLDAWSEGVSCSSDDWENYGSGRGEDFQRCQKELPASSAEIHALTLRNLCNHYGPVIRFEVTLKTDADRMFKAVQDYLDETEPEVA